MNRELTPVPGQTNNGQREPANAARFCRPSPAGGEPRSPQPAAISISQSFFHAVRRSCTELSQPVEVGAGSGGASVAPVIDGGDLRAVPAPSVHYTPVAGRELFSGGRHSTMHNIMVSVDTVMTPSCLWDHDHSPTVPLSSSAVHFQTHPDRRPP